MNTRIKHSPNPLVSPRMRMGAGFLLWVMAMGIAACTGLLLSGCAGVSQAVQAYGSVAVTNAKAVDDTVIEAHKVGFCGLPLSAITRHPEIIPAIRVMCLAPGDANGAALLDAAGAAK